MHPSASYARLPLRAKRLREGRRTLGPNREGVNPNALHVTNGDSVLHLWKKSGLPGTHVAWRDLLHEGPVPAGPGLEELSRVRAAYLAQRGYGSKHLASHASAISRRIPGQ